MIFQQNPEPEFILEFSILLSRKYLKTEEYVIHSKCPLITLIDYGFRKEWLAVNSTKVQTNSV